MKTAAPELTQIIILRGISENCQHTRTAGLFTLSATLPVFRYTSGKRRESRQTAFIQRLKKGKDGDTVQDLVIYVHGKGGSAQEAEHYKLLFPKDEVIGFDYRSQTPWEAKEEFLSFFAGQRNRCEHLTLIANSIGAFFALSALDDTLVDRAYLISPVVDMENLICKMMQWSNVTEQELAEKREIATNFGETLSWEYLCYVRQHPIIWNVPNLYSLRRARSPDIHRNGICICKASTMQI